MTFSPPSTVPNRFIQVDEEGYFHFNGVRITDDDYGHHLFENLMRDDSGRFLTEAQGSWAIVEAFDQALVAQQVDKDSQGQWFIQLPYDYKVAFQLDSLTLDEWDRFHGFDEKGRPFVLSRKAQATFFDMLEEFDDTGVTDHGRRYEVGPWLPPKGEVNGENFWSDIYREKEKPGWELDEPAPPLKEILPQLKLPRCRVLVLGSGSGNDAAYLAQQGHMVTAVDISSEAIQKAKDKYSGIDNLHFVQGDLFNLPEDFHHSFDIVLEHTCFCAITPDRRDDMVKVWKRMLSEGGHLLGIFFVMPQRNGPPFGASEWEIRERLKKSFQFLYWTRWKTSKEARLGKELVVYAQKTSLT